MFAYSLKKSELTAKRLDPKFYSPEQIVNEKKLSALFSEPLESLRIEDAPIVYGILKPEGTSEGLYRVAKAEKFQGMFVDSDDCDEVSKTVYESFKRSVAKTGDVLIAIGGYVGRPAILNVKSGANCNINRHISRVRVDSSKIDPYYLVVFLSSRHGQKRLERQITGSVQAGINLEDLREVHVNLFEKATQKYIGDKVRQAEQLRAWAKRLEDAVYRYHSQFIPDQEHLDFNKKTRMVSVKRMTERLDAHFYPGVVEQYLIAHPGKFESVSALTSAIYNGQTQPESSEEFCEQITVAHLSASFVKGQPRKVKAPAKNNKFVKPHDILMCNAAHNKSYIGRDLTYVHTDKELLPSTEVMTIRIDRDQVPASYVRAYLLSRLGYVKIQSTIRGITAHSYPDDVALLDIYIPEVEPSKKEEWFKQDDLLVQAGFAVELAQLLTSSAKILVEALIEGQLTEQQLIQAQQAFEDGDNSLDQAVLSKLSSEGYGIDGATPLFNDVDELYRLLESAAQAEAEA